MPIFGTTESHIDSKDRIIVGRLFKNQPMDNDYLIGESINSNMIRFYLTSKLHDLMLYVERNINTKEDINLYKRICKILASETENVITKPDTQGRISLLDGSRDNCKFSNYNSVSIGEGNGFSVITSPEVFEKYRHGDYGYSLLTENPKIR